MVHFMKREFTAVINKVGRWHIGWIEEVPGINTQGRTMKEVRENLREALLLVLEENKKIYALKQYTAHRETFRVAVPV